MTKLTYMIGDAEVATYAEAMKLSAEKRMPMVPKYTSIIEHSAYNAERVARKLEKRLARRV